LPALAGFASTIVERVYREGVPQLVASADDAEALGSESALAQDLRSILAVPLLAARDRVTGVLYLDSTVAKGLFTQDDLPLVSALARHIATSHESVRAARIEAERAAFARDLELTAAVQSMFLPVREELELGRVSLAGTYRAAALCSGDWWWFEQVGDEIFVITGDVTGHGAGPAMITALVATTFRERRKQPGGDDPRAILQGIDETLRDLAQGRYWMATCFVALNTKTLAYRAFHGGAPPVFIKDAEGSFRTLSIPSSPLGGPSFDVHESTGQLVPGELMVLASDGILEMQAAGDRPVGARGLRKLLVQKAPLGPRAAVTAIMDELDRMRASEEREDDMTIVMLAAR
jgi:serine phosphatase RsbU (regulator of sigma subunit)